MINLRADPSASFLNHRATGYNTLSFGVLIKKQKRHLVYLLTKKALQTEGFK